MRTIYLGGRAPGAADRCILRMLLFFPSLILKT